MLRKMGYGDWTNDVMGPLFGVDAGPAVGPGGDETPV